MWRWAAGVWAALVLVGGGLTLWLQDLNEPDPPARWERAPAPRLGPAVPGTGCPTQGPSGAPTMEICVYATVLEPGR